MNNRYLFRAKRIDNGEWIKGFYVKTRIGNDGSPSDVIFVPWIENRNEKWGFIKVDPSTICRCTALRDKNGKLIWENDVLTINAYSYEEPEDAAFGVVKYSECECGFCLDTGTKWIPICELRGSYTTEIFKEGSIFDNPELLELEQ